MLRRKTCTVQYWNDKKVGTLVQNNDYALYVRNYLEEGGRTSQPTGYSST